MGGWLDYRQDVGKQPGKASVPGATRDARVESNTSHNSQRERHEKRREVGEPTVSRQTIELRG